MDDLFLSLCQYEIQQRQRLNALIGKAADDIERKVVQPLETTTPDASRRAGYRDGRRDERQRTLALIDGHLRCHKRTSMNTMSLESLRSAVAGA